MCIVLWILYMDKMVSSTVHLEEVVWIIRTSFVYMYEVCDKAVEKELYPSDQKFVFKLIYFEINLGDQDKHFAPHIEFECS